MRLKINPMNKNSFFNIKRFLHLLRREAHINLKRNLLIIGALYSIFTIIMFLVFEFGEEDFKQEVLENFHMTIFFVLLFTGGAFITSFSFIELRDKMKSHFYLLTPGSNFEKFLVNITISLIGYTVFMLISYLAYSTLFNWAALQVYHIDFYGLNFVDENFRLIMQIFIASQSLFFLGALTFKKYPVILTPIAGFIVLAMFSLFIELMGNMIFPDLEVRNRFYELSMDDFIQQHENWIHAIMLYILPVIIWFTTYLKLNEKEY